MSDGGCFIFELKNDADAVFAKVRELARINDIELKGDKRKGSFSTGILKGSYEVSGNEIRISVIDKPYLVDQNNLKDILKDLFSGNDTRNYREVFGYMNLKRF